MVNKGFFVLKLRCIMGADLSTLLTANTQILIYVRFSGTVHFHFACTGTASHTDVFQCTAKSGGFMAFKMGEGNENVRIHNCAADFGLFHILAALHRHQRFIGSFQAVGDQYLAAGGERIKAV